MILASPCPLITHSNPPGLARKDIANAFNLRPSASPLDIPYNLTTGCYEFWADMIGPPASPQSSCYGRILHATLNKDKGVINERTGAASNAGTPRGKAGTNFENAVRLAIEDTRRQWSDFRIELRRTYGDVRGNRMICVLTRDEPWKMC